MRALFLCGFHPSHDAVSSGPKIVAREIDSLVMKGWDVVTVSFENELDRRHFNSGFPPPPGPDSRLFRLTRWARVAGAILNPKIPLAGSARPFLAGKWVNSLLAQNRFERIDVEFIQAAELLPREYWCGATLIPHDVLSQLYRRRLARAVGWRKLLLKAELQRVEHWEKTVLKGYGRIKVLNEKDRQLVEELTDRTDIFVRYPDVPRYIDPAERLPEEIDPSMLLFWAHMGRSENVDAVKYFVRAIMPRILATRPDARLVVAGIDPPDCIKDLQSRNVTVTGFVQDPAPLFRSAAVGVVPMRLGAGIKIKTLEMLACGLPVVATSVGAEGVKPSPLLFEVDDETGFADAVLSRLSPQTSLGSALAGEGVCGE
jgi:glycosyltransferase involved in cell wall biosynthesis